MARLHPDKIVGVARAVRARPTVPNKAPDPGRVKPAEKPFMKSDPKGEEAGSLIESLAYRLRDAHQAGHLNRMARVDKSTKAAGPKKKPTAKSKPSFPDKLPPPKQMPAFGEDRPPIIQFNFGQPRRNA